MNIKRWLLLGAMVVISTALGYYLVVHSGLNWGWGYEIVAWFVAWLCVFFIVKKRWLYSIAAVIVISVMEDALFLLWARIIGDVNWSTPFYSHDWVPFCQNWGGIPSHYVYSLIVAGIFVLIGRRKYPKK